MSTPLAGPDRSQEATTERRIGRKPRKFRDQFESMQCPEKPFYNNDLWMAEGVGFEPSVCQSITLRKPLNSLINPGWSTFPRTRDSPLNPERNDLRLSTDWAICITELAVPPKPA